MAKRADLIHLPALFLLSTDVTRYLAPELAVDGFLTVELRDWARKKLLSSFHDDDIDLDGLQNSVRGAQAELGKPMVGAIAHWRKMAFPREIESVRRWVWMMLFLKLRDVWEAAEQNSRDPLCEEEYAWVRVLIRQRVTHSCILRDEVDDLLERSRSEWDPMVASRYSDWFDVRSQIIQTADSIAAAPLWSVLLRELPSDQLRRLADWAVRIAREERLPVTRAAFPSV
ncbi:MAG TPA: hypothetical protein VGM51_19320 [Armatimonadota bacterium]|jgi:hypothetical protein